jgi:hypothetical protein
MHSRSFTKTEVGILGYKETMLDKIILACVFFLVLDGLVIKDLLD